MKTQIIIFVGALIVAVTASVTGVPCACTELTQQTDCAAQSTCTWANSACSAVTVAACSTFITQPTCDAISGCAWNSNSTCATFTKCTDYSVSTASICYAKDVTCSAGTVSNGTYPCVTQNLTSCSTITDASTCSIVGCVYASNACAAATCSSLASSACTAVESNTIGTFNICSVSNSACTDATDVSSLTASTCYTSTLGTYAWNSTASVCQACKGSTSSTTTTTTSSNSYLLAVLGLVNVILF